MSLLKGIERLGRQLLVSLLGLLLGVRRRPVTLPPAPHLLVVRLDERVGNLLLLLPLLESLKQRFPDARLDLLASAKTRALCGSHPTLSAFLPFRKKAWFAADGPLRAATRLRRRRYDLAIDAANPTDPSATQVILVRLSGARHTVGVDLPGFGRLFTAPVAVSDPTLHEIDLRLALLAPLPGDGESRRMRLEQLPALSTPSRVADLIRATASERRVILNLGARLSEKRLGPQAYAAIAQAAADRHAHVLLTYGPSEAELAGEVARHCPAAAIAPPTDLVELAHLMQAARAVVTCDTGPMHLAVAVGTPTCGIFVSTEPRRYGHAASPHLVIDARESEAALWLPTVVAWLERTL